MRSFFKFAAIIFFANFALLTYFVYAGAFSFYDFIAVDFDKYFYGEEPMSDRYLGQIILTTVWAFSLLIAFGSIVLRGLVQEPEVELTETDLKGLEETAEASNTMATEEARREQEELERLHASQEKEASLLVTAFDDMDFKQETAEQRPERMLKKLAGLLEAGQGLVYKRTESQAVELCGTFAFIPDETFDSRVEFGSGFVGESARSQKLLSINDIPDAYITIVSGLGDAQPHHLLVVPLVWEDVTIGVMEMAIFRTPNDFEKGAIREIAGRIGRAMYKDMKDLDVIKMAFNQVNETENVAVVAE